MTLEFCSKPLQRLHASSYLDSITKNSEKSVACFESDHFWKTSKTRDRMKILQTVSQLTDILLCYTDAFNASWVKVEKFMR